MKNIFINIIILSLSTLLFSSCNDDFLTRDAGVNMPLDTVFSDPLYAKRFADNSYNFLIDDYMRLNGVNSAIAQFTDEAMDATGDDRQLQVFNSGTFRSTSSYKTLNEVEDVYSRMYAGIRNANIVIENIGKARWSSQSIPDNIKGEQYFLRAFFYHELTKRFGGVIITNKVFKNTDDIDLPRSSYETCIDSIISDLNHADALLPLDWDAANTGRATIGASKALRSRVLLYAASTRDNPQNDKTKWQKAATAAKAVMDMNKYSLHANYSGLMQATSSPEFIMLKVRGPRPAFSTTNMWTYICSNSRGGGYSNFNPTQNHVDLYEMKTTGKPISDPTSGYNPAEPFLNRDPRFEANILYNDVTFQGTKMEMWRDTIGLGPNGTILSAKDQVPNFIYTTASGYYCRKYWPDVYKAGSTQTTFLNYFFFRYGEILLNYAEAQNEAVGPDASVYAVLNLIRARAGMPDLPAGLTQAQMRDRIRNERAVELAFEDQRWWDILRWKIGLQVIKGPLFGMDAIKLRDGSFKYRKVQLSARYDRMFYDFNHYYPIPVLEIQKSKGVLIQNPDWK